MSASEESPDPDGLLGRLEQVRRVLGDRVADAAGMAREGVDGARRGVDAVRDGFDAAERAARRLREAAERAAGRPSSKVEVISIERTPKD